MRASQLILVGVTVSIQSEVALVSECGQAGIMLIPVLKLWHKVDHCLTFGRRVNGSE